MSHPHRGPSRPAFALAPVARSSARSIAHSISHSTALSVALSIALSVALSAAACQRTPAPGVAEVGAPATPLSARRPTLPAPPAPVAERGPTSSPVAGASFGGGDNASFQGVTIVWPEGLASGAGVKAEPATSDSPDAAPPATVFVLDGYADEEPLFPATIKVYALGQAGPVLTDAVASLERILDDQPAEPKVPMPATPASRVFMAHVRYVDGEGYRGVRFVTQLAQDIQPVNNASLAYAFEGLSDDGTRWIQARLPIDARSDAVLPDANIADYAGFAARFDSYLVATTAAIDALAPTDFTPALGDLDAFVGGVRFR